LGIDQAEILLRIQREYFCGSFFRRNKENKGDWKLGYKFLIVKLFFELLSYWLNGDNFRIFNIN